MSKSMIALLGLAVLSGPTWGADPPSNSEFDSKIKIPSNIGFSTTLSPDKQVATILFDNMIVSLEPTTQSQTGTHGQTALQTKLATLHIPYKTDQRSVTMTMDLRGANMLGNAASSRLVACVGDKTAVVDLSADDKNRVELKGKCKQTAIKSGGR